ncbi:hypothetical protein [Novipirellula artificiosorum]|uniref:BON domain protein n=1 Tax=Novipirellula artificiosorum TaxID=2528016 RepID=A0A5C6DQI2_9BACT|nr:hypothetical protein [Novipirellula artificiosorum]TWU38485.1 hypothetical protein Poly41_29610 [Novipirellula artificiosorum]
MIRQRTISNIMRVMLFLAISLLASNAEAQLFGARTLGQPLTRRPNSRNVAPAEIESAGVVEGDERFLRDNRSRNDFVGSNRGALQGFVGSEQAIGVGRVRTSVESLRDPPDLSTQINRPLPRLRRGTMYYPRLSIDGFDLSSKSFAATVVSKRDIKLQSLLTQTAGSNIQIEHQGDRTILRGSVASEQMAEKLRILASFEPHIHQIESQLTIANR